VEVAEPLGVGSPVAFVVQLSGADSPTTSKSAKDPGERLVMRTSVGTVSGAGPDQEDEFAIEAIRQAPRGWPRPVMVRATLA